VIAENLTNLIFGHGRPTLYPMYWSTRPEWLIMAIPCGSGAN
jgi:hypothetical protein